MSKADTTLNVITAGALCVVLLLALRPDGVLGSSLLAWNRNRRVMREVNRTWTDLVAGAPRIDSGTDSVMVVEFADFQCPSCKRMYDEFAVRGGTARPGIVFRNFPLASHPAAEGAARAAICAAAQGRFAEMYAALFRAADWQTDTNWVREAGRAGVADIGAFMGCLHSATADARLAADKALGLSLSVSGTPTFFTRRRTWSGVRSVSEFGRLAGAGP